MNPGTAEEELDGIETREPAFGLPALWIPQSMKDRAETAGYTVIDCSSVIATHLMEVVKSYAADLLGRQEVQILIDNLRATHPVVVDELLPNIMTVGEVQKIMQNLLKERISVRNLLLICEKLADEARASKDPVYLTEKVRQALARSICQEYRLPDGTMPVITLEPQVEQSIAETVQHPEKDTYAALDPNTIRLIYASLLREVEKVTTMGFQPIVLCSQTVRLYFKRLTERVLPNLVVLSYNEILAEVMVEAVGQIRLTQDTESFH
jgi:flagellar biosynthesis protein FlhA